MAVWLVADFEALSYQVTTTFNMSCATRLRTAPAINYTACYQLGVLVCQWFEIMFYIRHSVFPVLKDLVFLVSAKKRRKQAGSLAGFGFSVGFERPDNVPACVCRLILLRFFLSNHCSD